MNATGTFPFPCPALSRATVFNLPYTVKVYGTEYGADRLANIRLSRSLSGKGFDGISTACFSCDIYTETVFSEGASVVFDGYLLPTFYIASQSHSGGVSHIECYDCCKNLDIPFNYSNYEQFEKKEDGSYDESKAKWYPTSQVIGDIANQCGFAGSSPSVSRIDSLCYLDFKGKSCRQILEMVSKIGVGRFSANSDNQLIFTPFYPDRSGFSIAEIDRTEIQLRGTKTISGIVAEDEVYGGIYSSGASWKNSERISGRRITAEIAASMTSQILGSGGSYEYNGWECPAAIVSMPYNIGDCIAYDGKLLPILEISCNFTALGIIAAMSAPAADTSFSEYQDLYSRQLDGTVKLDRVFGCSRITRDGVKLVCGDSEEYGFKTFAGGLAEFGGAMLDSVMPDEIVTVSETDTAVEQRIVYGGKTYTLKYTKDGTKKSNISFTEVVV